METQKKGSSFEGGEGVERKEKEVKVETKGRRMRSCEVVLRLLALALTLVAAIVLGVNKETKMVPMTLSPSLPPLNVPVTAKWRYLSAFV